MQKLKEIGLHPEQMLANLPAFMNKITSLLQELNISLTEYKADHIALRVNNYADAELLHQAWLEYGVEWSNNWINGRPIIVIGFTQPLQVGDWTIEALELPYLVIRPIHCRVGSILSLLFHRMREQPMS